jgi:hypothetical protein
MFWNPNAPQQTRIFNWRSILEEWSQTLVPTPYIETVQKNLRVATEYPYSYSFPLTHFLSYLNEEQEGIAWLIHEICSTRWMYGRIRSDYLRGLVLLVDDLDSGFPAFVGSPYDSTTIREFLEAQLTAEELDTVNMMPRLVALPPSIHRERFEARQRHRASASVAATAAQAAAQPQALLPITLRFMRPGLDSKHDDIVNIYRMSENAFKITFRDGDGKHKSRARNLTRTEVMEYMSNTLRLVAIDEEPFANVQLLAPNMPTVVIKPNNMTSQTRDLIYDTVQTTMNNWPVSV